MSGNENDGPANSGDDPEADAALSDRLKQLKERLDGGNSDSSDGAQRSGPSPIAQAFRLSSELVAGVAVGFGFGWGVDWLLGSAPWGMIIFVMLGFAAGILNLLRATGHDPNW